MFSDWLAVCLSPVRLSLFSGYISNNNSTTVSAKLTIVTSSIVPQYSIADNCYSDFRLANRTTWFCLSIIDTPLGKYWQRYARIWLSYAVFATYSPRFNRTVNRTNSVFYIATLFSLDLRASKQNSKAKCFDFLADLGMWSSFVREFYLKQPSRTIRELSLQKTWVRYIYILLITFSTIKSLQKAFTSLKLASKLRFQNPGTRQSKKNLGCSKAQGPTAVEFSFVLPCSSPLLWTNCVIRDLVLPLSYTPNAC